MAEYIERKKLIDLCNEIINCDWNKKHRPFLGRMRMNVLWKTLIANPPPMLQRLSG